MDKRFALFAVLVALIFVVNQIIFSIFFPPEPVPPAADGKQVAEAAPDDAPQAEGEAEQPAQDDPATEAAAPDEAEAAGDASGAEPPAAAEPADQQPEQVEPARGTLGSIDPNSPYRMLVTWNNRGAAIERVELNHYRALESEMPWGYLGYLAPIDAPDGGGVLVRVVGPGSPAAEAGLAPGDIITSLDQSPTRTAAEYLIAIQATEPDQEIDLTVQRGDKSETLSIILARQPLDVIRPEYETKPVEVVEPGKHDPLSFLTTIQQYEERVLGNDNKELGGVNLRSEPWEVVAADSESVQFRKRVPLLSLELTKTYRLAKTPEESQDDSTFPSYHLTLDLTVTNVGDARHKVAYRLDGPTGLPIEGAWFANSVSREFFASAGLRDVIASFTGQDIAQVSPSQLAEDDFDKSWGATASLDFIGVDAQYFSVALIPQTEKPGTSLFESITPIRAGAVPEDSADVRLLDVSFRLDSLVAELDPGESLKHSFQVFAGPKRTTLLSQYGPDGDLRELVYYGWFWPVARVLSEVLHAFYSVVGNYGIAIIMLTVLVRGCMFPLSRKQALGAQKMQELQPEIKKINEKYKSDAEKRTRAMQELFRNHNYNPVGGCMLAIAQLPIFVGLYRSLMVDVELRQAPLFTEGIRWASNLAAPDMFWNWTGVMPAFITNGTGLLGLGPYLNILPLVTVALFIWQQKMFMPPPADEQAAMQQKMMQYMMIFMGILFFKVASGLCVYFIASSLWGVCERKLLPKTIKKPDADAPAVPVATAGNGNGAAGGRRRKQRGRK